NLLFQRLQHFKAVVGQISAITELLEHAQANFLVDWIIVRQEQTQRQTSRQICIQGRGDRRLFLPLQLDAHCAAKGIEHLGGTNRFVNVNRCAEFSWARVVAAQAGRREQQQWRVRPLLLTNSIGQSKAVVIWQLHVNYNDIRFVQRQEPKRLPPIG